jgi:GxxExxY protein
MEQMPADFGAATEQESSTEEAVTRERTRRIIGAAMEVHNQLGYGFLEGVYQAALAIELGRQGIPFVRECDLPVYYRGELLPCAYRADFLCYSSIVVELKALARLGEVERAQVMNYLKATGMARGLLLNFGTERLEFKRVIWTPNLPTSAVSADRKGASWS